jgi:VanZ family protein
MKKKKKLNVVVLKRIIWIITLLWISIIFYFSSQPADLSRQASGELLVKMDQLEEDEIQNISDRRVWNLHYYIRKFAHFVLYCGLGFLMVFSVISIKYRSYVSYIIAWLASSLYGVLDELHQNFVPGRGATIADMKLDAVSALAGVVLAAVLIEVWRVYNAKKELRYGYR